MTFPYAPTKGNAKLIVFAVLATMALTGHAMQLGQEEEPRHTNGVASLDDLSQTCQEDFESMLPWKTSAREACEYCVEQARRRGKDGTEGKNSRCSFCSIGGKKGHRCFRNTQHFTGFQDSTKCRVPMKTTIKDCEKLPDTITDHKKGGGKYKSNTEPSLEPSSEPSSASSSEPTSPATPRTVALASAATGSAGVSPMLFPPTAGEGQGRQEEVPLNQQEVARSVSVDVRVRNFAALAEMSGVPTREAMMTQCAMSNAGIHDTVPLFLHHMADGSIALDRRPESNAEDSDAEGAEPMRAMHLKFHRPDETELPYNEITFFTPDRESLCLRVESEQIGNLAKAVLEALVDHTGPEADESEPVRFDSFVHDEGEDHADNGGPAKTCSQLDSGDTCNAQLVCRTSATGDSCEARQRWRDILDPEHGQDCIWIDCFEASTSTIARGPEQKLRCPAPAAGTSQEDTCRATVIGGWKHHGSPKGWHGSHGIMWNTVIDAAAATGSKRQREFTEYTVPDAKAQVTWKFDQATHKGPASIGAVARNLLRAAVEDPDTFLDMFALFEPTGISLCEHDRAELERLAEHRRSESDSDQDSDSEQSEAASNAPDQHIAQDDDLYGEALRSQQQQINARRIARKRRMIAQLSQDIKKHEQEVQTLEQTHASDRSETTLEMTKDNLEAEKQKLAKLMAEGEIEEDLHERPSLTPETDDKDGSGAAEKGRVETPPTTTGKGNSGLFGKVSRFFGTSAHSMSKGGSSKREVNGLQPSDDDDDESLVEVGSKHRHAKTDRRGRHRRASSRASRSTKAFASAAHKGMARARASSKMVSLDDAFKLLQRYGKHAGVGFAAVGSVVLMTTVVMGITVISAGATPVAAVFAVAGATALAGLGAGTALAATAHSLEIQARQGEDRIEACIAQFEFDDSPLEQTDAVAWWRDSLRNGPIRSQPRPRSSPEGPESRQMPSNGELARAKWAEKVAKKRLAKALTFSKAAARLKVAGKSFEIARTVLVDCYNQLADLRSIHESLEGRTRHMAMYNNQMIETRNAFFAELKPRYARWSEKVHQSRHHPQGWIHKSLIWAASKLDEDWKTVSQEAVEATLPVLLLFEEFHQRLFEVNTHYRSEQTSPVHHNPDVSRLNRPAINRLIDDCNHMKAQLTESLPIVNARHQLRMQDANNLAEKRQLFINDLRDPWNLVRESCSQIHDEEAPGSLRKTAKGWRNMIFDMGYSECEEAARVLLNALMTHHHTLAVMEGTEAPVAEEEWNQWVMVSPESRVPCLDCFGGGHDSSPTGSLGDLQHSRRQRGAFAGSSNEHQRQFTHAASINSSNGGAPDNPLQQQQHHHHHNRQVPPPRTTFIADGAKYSAHSRFAQQMLRTVGRP